MGDRANVKVVERDSTVFLYTHWSGSALPGTVQAALKRGERRWNDGQYLARIIFCEMMDGREDELTGYGITSVAYDGDDRIITVNLDGQFVQVGGGKRKSFTEYIADGYEPDWGE